jgi:hypothetical protein
MHGAKYLKRSRKLRDMHTMLVDIISKVLAEGEKKGEIKAGIDPLHLYISISALSYLYFSNSATLSAAFGRQLSNAAEQQLRRSHCVDVILSYVRAR